LSSGKTELIDIRRLVVTAADIRRRYGHMRAIPLHRGGGRCRFQPTFVQAISLRISYGLSASAPIDIR
jgi:hypothetical protein